MSLAIGLALWTGCGKEHEHGQRHHSHEAPNGGTMVELNHHKCHLEFFRDEITQHDYWRWRTRSIQTTSL